MFCPPSVCKRASASAFAIIACICDIGTICSLDFSVRLLLEGLSFGVLPPFGGFFDPLDFFPPRLFIEPEGSSWRAGLGGWCPPPLPPPTTLEPPRAPFPPQRGVCLLALAPAAGCQAGFAFALPIPPILIGFRGGAGRMAWSHCYPRIDFS